MALREIVTAGRSRPDAVWLESARDGRIVTRGDLARIADTWAQFIIRRRRLARTSLAGGGSAPRAHPPVGLLAEDPLDFAVLFVCLIAAGVTVVPLDPRAPALAHRELLRRSRAGALLATRRACELGMPTIEVGRLLSPRPAADGRTDDRGSDDEVGGARGRRRAPRRADGPPAPGGVLLFSSGSTGPRKAILLSEPRLLHVARAVAHHHRLTADDRGYNPLPLFHVNAEVVAVLGALVSGGALVLDDLFHRTGFLDEIARLGITWINAVPAILSILAAEPGRDTLPGTVRFVRSASAPLPAAVLHRFEARYGTPVLETYGMTEAASQITANPLEGPRRPGSVGLPVGVDLQVRDGRIHIRGDGVITGYADGSGSDRFDADGWLDTGDVGRLDEDGYLYLSGRSTEVINRGGEKVFPREIEEVLRRHERVRDAAVVPRQDDVLGQVPIAFLVADTGRPGDPPAGREQTLLIRQVEDLCAESLPRAYRPVALHLVTSLPLGPTGKVSRAALIRAAQTAPAGTSR